MPARKPQDISTGAKTKAARKKRADGENALTPSTPLTATPPEHLEGDVAQATWREIVGTYLMLDARIVSMLDLGLLMDYCVATQQLAEVDSMRSVAMSNYITVQSNLDNLDAAQTDPKTLAKLNLAVNWAYDVFLKLDARVDNKRKMLHTMRQSLYLTPRSRAGAQPAERQETPARSKMAEIIDG